MRPIAFSAVFALLPVFFPSSVYADVSALPADRLEALLQSEFQFQSGQFEQAFAYYRSHPMDQFDSDEIQRGTQLATVLGQLDWLAAADQSPALAMASQPEMIRRRFEWALREGEIGMARESWQALLRYPQERGVYLARAAVDAYAGRYQAALDSALAEYANQSDLTAAERFELFQFAIQWRLDGIADALQMALPEVTSEAKQAAAIRDCMSADAAACSRRLQAVDPLALTEWQRRSMLVLAQKVEDTNQQLRWLEVLPQDGSSYYQRIVRLARAMDETRARSLMAQLRADTALNDFQRAVLQGSLSELLKDWPAAESHYRDALSADAVTTASVRLAVVLFRQGRRDEAFAQLQGTAADVRLSDEVRRDALQTEIQFHRILRSDQRDAEVVNAVYRRGLAHWPQANALRYQLAMRLYGQGRVDSAILELKKILRAAPADVDALNAYGFVLAKALDQPRAAYKPIACAFLLAPEQPQILDSYGYVLYRLGRNQEALVPLQKAWHLMPAAVTAGHLGQVFLRLGDRQRANDYLEKGLKLDASEAELLALQEQLR